MSRIKAVIFDLDGTLLNRDESVQKFIKSQYNRIISSVESVNQMDYMARFIELDRHGYVSKDEVYAQLTYDFAFHTVSSDRLLKDYTEQFNYSCVPYPNLSVMLHELKRRKYKLGMITNGYGRFQMDNIERLGIDHLFDTILISEWEGVKKPNPEIFMLALERLGVSSSEAIYMGDHPINDIQASMHVGMTSVWKRTDVWNDIEIEADFTIDELNEILMNPLLIDI
ncbi:MULTISPECIES: HAD family hydrolase [unclassified Exiguobacterium]|uniref:HAD family hydrolase n=1 Tax=unclassified Exiguobacterium TaxID=2644629 RepID=UPI001BE5999B|nr:MULTISPECIES: HAD family hydrolase [unclassified Exiguobacterium]